MHVNMKTVFIIMGEVIHVLNIMKCMDSDIMYIMIYGTPHVVFYKIEFFTCRTCTLYSLDQSCV